MPRGPRRLLLFARRPIAGKAKTRLIPALDAEGAAALHRRLVLRTLRTAYEACRIVPAELGADAGLIGAALVGFEALGATGVAVARG